MGDLLGLTIFRGSCFAYYVEGLTTTACTMSGSFLPSLFGQLFEGLLCRLLCQVYTRPHTDLVVQWSQANCCFIVTEGPLHDSCCLPTCPDLQSAQRSVTLVTKGTA